jgi:hypothetical protein
MGGTFFNTLTSNQMVIGTTHTTTVSFSQPSVSRSITFPDPGANANVGYDINMPKRCTMWHIESTSTVGSGWSSAVQALSYYNYETFQSSPAINDRFTNGCHLAAGTYTFSVLARVSNNNGNITWNLDGIDFGSNDWYAANGGTGGYNNIKTVSSVIVSSSGWHKLTGTIASKNAASSNYYFNAIKFWFSQASD